MKNGPFIGFVASLLVLIAVALWQFSVLASNSRLSSPYAGGPYGNGKSESGPLDSNQVKPALSRSPK